MKTSQALENRIERLRVKMCEAQITANDLAAFQKVAAIMQSRHGHFDPDALIAASFSGEHLG